MTGRPCSQSLTKPSETSFADSSLSAVHRRLLRVNTALLQSMVSGFTRYLSSADDPSKRSPVVDRLK